MGRPLAPLASINELPDSLIERRCGKSRAGCAVTEDGVVKVYYRNGDECALRHELCHAMHGERHTLDYTRRVIAGDPRPYCGG